MKVPEKHEVVTHVIPDDPSDEYFAMALRLIKPNWDINRQTLEDKQNAMVSCICSFFSLESAINRVFYEVFEKPEHERPTIHSNIPPTFVDHIKNSWPRFSIKDKFLLLPPLIAKPNLEFKSGVPPFSFFEEFIRFRNRLVHPKMLIHTYTVKVTDVDMDLLGGSWSGDVIDQESTAPNSRGTFPLTHFSTSFNSINYRDSEIALEIALRLRIKLFNAVMLTLPSLTYTRNDGVVQFKIGDSIADLIKLHLGPLT